MALYDVIDSIQKCTFLLDVQKQQITHMLKEEAPDDKADYEQLVDCVLQKLFDLSIDDLTTMERVMLNQAIEDYYIG